MRIRTELAIATVLAALLPLIGMTAASASALTFKQASFKATVKGAQTYVYHQDHESTGRCDPSIKTDDKETVRFWSTKAVKLTASQAGRSEPFFTSGKKVLRGFPTEAKVNRTRSHSYSPVPDDCGGNGGGVEPGPPEDCGERTVKPWLLAMDYYRRDHIELQPASGADLDPFDNCSGGEFPYLLNGETFGKRTSASLPASELFDTGIGKLITVGRGNRFLAIPDGYIETKVRWELSLTRIKSKDGSGPDGNGKGSKDGGKKSGKRR